MSRKSGTRSYGCSMIAVTGLVTILLLVINTGLVRAVLREGELRIDPRAAQPLQFMLPLVLIFVEFWIFDSLARLLRPSRRNR